jgi:hypothetical protein
MQAGADSLGADGCADAVAIHVSPQIVIDASKCDRHSLVREFVDEIKDRLRRREIEIRDRGGVDDEPTKRRWSRTNQRAHFLGEAVLIGIEQIGPEAVHDQTRLGHLPNPGRNR